MQYFALGLAALAALVAVIRRRWALLAWTVIALTLSGIGLYDFYRWEYDYGHNLNPEAAIKIEGMSYQPPMFGTKQLLNFNTTAWPGAGGILAMVGVGLGVLASAYELMFRNRRRRGRPRAVADAHKRAAIAILSVAFAATGASCAKKPASISFGVDACEYCGMTISDDRYGAVLVTEKGRSHKFDAVECLAQATSPNEKFGSTGVFAVFVVPFDSRGALVPAESASFLISPVLPSPMGANITAFSTQQHAEDIQRSKPGEILDWPDAQTHGRSRAGM
jgi:copper chaperone NosL